MQITLEIKDTIFDKFLWMLEHFKNDVKIIEQDSESIDVEHCLNIKEKIDSDDLSGFEPIDDIDKHVNSLGMIHIK